MEKTERLDPDIREAVSLALDFYPYPATIDWDDFLDRVEVYSGVDLGQDLLSPLVLSIKKYARELRRLEY